MYKASHDQRRWLKFLKFHLKCNVRERSMGLRDLSWVDGARLPK